jgi:aryl-alcohol dehydrogenase (NADP+)
MLHLCREEGIGVIPFSPLARGFIAGNRNREKSGDTLRAQSDDLSRSYFFTEQDFALVDRITEVAERLGTSNARLAMAWVLQQPGITSPIIGATKPHHISDAVAALELKLDESDLQSLTDPYKPRPIMAHS